MPTALEKLKKRLTPEQFERYLESKKVMDARLREAEENSKVSMKVLKYTFNS